MARQYHQPFGGLVIIMHKETISTSIVLIVIRKKAQSQNANPKLSHKILPKKVSSN